MSLDGLSIHNLAIELKAELVTGRISKIYQPSKTEIVFQVRQQGCNKKLLISVHPNYARIHLTDHKYDAPQDPPMFCMMLRKHLEGSFIEKVEQHELERIVKIFVKTRDEIGDEKNRILLVEIMGKHSNISLVDQHNGKIIECMKHIGHQVNRHRALLPGFSYEFPPKQDKFNPFLAGNEEIVGLLDWNAGKLDKQLLNQFLGLSPQIAKEIVHRAGLANQKTLPRAFYEVIGGFKEGKIEPQITDSNGKAYFSLIELTHLEGNRTEYSTISQLLDNYFYSKALRDRVRQVAHDLELKLQSELQKTERKIVKLKEELEEAKAAGSYQKFGELLTTYSYSIEPGQSTVQLLDYYCEEESYVWIQLNPFKSPIENAQAYFKIYNKFKNSIPIIEEQLKIAHEDVTYLQMILQQIESASVRDIVEIREELAEIGLIRNRQKSKKNKPTKPVIDSYLASDGTEILVGKNNKQNDYITHKLANRSEVWLHTKDIPGSHVLIRSESPSDRTLVEAAQLAAYYSKGKHSAQVPVDYTQIRNVKKVRGAKPGFVTYDQQKTLYVSPSFTHIELK